VPYFGPDNRMRSGRQVILAPRATRTASGSGPGVGMPEESTLRLTLDVSAASGTTPTLTVAVEHSRDGVTWTALDAFPQVTGAGTTHRTFGGVDNYVRATWSVGGTTPSFTFAVTGEAV
jgi:hypothetical protein